MSIRARVVTRLFNDRYTCSRIVLRVLHMNLSDLLLVSHALFCIGVFGLMTRRHAIGLLLSIELILNAAALNFVLFGRLFGQAQAQAFALFIIALAACEAVVGLAIIIALCRTANTVFADHANTLRG